MKVSKIEIRYKNKIIAKLDKKSSIVLLTKGKYLQDNISLKYAPNKKIEQEKTVIPTEYKQEFVPDSNNVFSKVIVNPITRDVVDNLTATNYISNIKTSLEEKGIILSGSEKIQDISQKILDIRTEGGSAAEPYVEEVFDSDDNLIGVSFHGHTITNKYAYNNEPELREVLLSSRLEEIQSYSFAGAAKLSSIAFPSSLLIIGDYAFSRCSSLSLIILPPRLQTVGISAFSSCTAITQVIFEGVPTIIDKNCFSNCSNLTTINVPWSEGEVANAPWGAINATINYNYQGGNEE